MTTSISESEFEVIVKFRYRVNTNPAQLRHVFGTTDLDECAQIDAQNEPHELMWLAESDVTMTVEVVR